MDQRYYFGEPNSSPEIIVVPGCGEGEALGGVASVSELRNASETGPAVLGNLRPFVRKSVRAQWALATFPKFVPSIASHDNALADSPETGRLATVIKLSIRFFLGCKTS
jgi:hypothetical protein